MACNSDLPGLIYRSSPKSAEEVCETSLMSGPQLLHDPGSSVFPTATNRLDPSANETTISTVGWPPDSSRFWTIAGELRNIIYKDLITSGDFAILRTSRTAHDEAKDLLYKYGICRLALKHKTNPKLLVFRNPPAHKVQNLNILVFLNTDPVNYRALFKKYEKLSREFIRYVQHPSDCHITLAYSKLCWNWYREPPSSLLGFIRSLSKFKLVTLSIHIFSYYHPRDRRNLEGGAKHDNLLQIFTDVLSMALGCPERKLDVGPTTRYQMSKYTKTLQNLNPFPNAQCLEFRPCLRPNFAEGVYH